MVYVAWEAAKVKEKNSSGFRMKHHHQLFVKTTEYKWNAASRAGKTASVVMGLMFFLAGQLGYELCHSLLPSCKYLLKCRTVVSSFYY